MRHQLAASLTTAAVLFLLGSVGTAAANGGAVITRYGGGIDNLQNPCAPEGTTDYFGHAQQVVTPSGHSSYHAVLTGTNDATGERSRLIQRRATINGREVVHDLIVTPSGPSGPGDNAAYVDKLSTEGLAINCR